MDEREIKILGFGEEEIFGIEKLLDVWILRSSWTLSSARILRSTWILRIAIRMRLSYPGGMRGCVDYRMRRYVLAVWNCIG